MILIINVSFIHCHLTNYDLVDYRVSHERICLLFIIMKYYELKAVKIRRFNHF